MCVCMCVCVCELQMVAKKGGNILSKDLAILWRTLPILEMISLEGISDS